jgi:Na+-translocating ferredoxin:NAD+ oxidoreductase subunit C
LLQKKLNQFFGYCRPRLPLLDKGATVSDAALPSRLVLPLVKGDGKSSAPAVLKGDEILPGMQLCAGENGNFLRSPVKGKVIAVTTAPGARGARTADAILVEPSADTASDVFEPLDVEEAPVADLLDRVRQAGILTATSPPRPLLELIGPESGVRIDRLVILAADREPEVCSSRQVFEERKADLMVAAKLLARIACPERVFLAVMQSDADSAVPVDGEVEILPLPAWYPETLIPVVAARAAEMGGPGGVGAAEGGGTVRVVPLETAIAALDAVREGRVQDRKVVTVIGPDGKARANLRVPIGMRLKDLLAEAGLEPGDKDKVLLGGPMRGFAQYSLESAVDAGVDAVAVIPAASVINWTDEPCINCGNCIDACPVNLQVQAIGRYAEFGLFDRTEELGLSDCIECGLCGMVCTARRPLLQFIRLAADEIARQKSEAEQARLEAAEVPDRTDNEEESEAASTEE